MSVEEKKLVDSLLETRRSFITNDVDTEYFIGAPTADDIRSADWQYSKTYTKCLNEGIPTSAELSDILRRRGVIGEDFDRRVEELGVILNELITRLHEAQTNAEKTSLAYEVAQARENLFQWNQRLSGPMSNTCEQISDDARLEFLTSCILQYEDGSKVWNTFDDFLKDKDRELTLKARYEVMLYLQGYESDFLSKTPEARAMREVQDEMLRDLELAQKAQDELAQKADSLVVSEVPESEDKSPVSKKSIKGSSKKVDAKDPISKADMVEKDIIDVEKG